MKRRTTLVVRAAVLTCCWCGGCPTGHHQCPLAVGDHVAFDKPMSPASSPTVTTGFWAGHDHANLSRFRRSHNGWEVNPSVGTNSGL